MQIAFFCNSPISSDEKCSLKENGDFFHKMFNFYYSKLVTICIFYYYN